MTPSAQCEAFIKANEGLILTVQPDAASQAIGYGHDLLPGESFPNGIDEAEAELLFQSDLAAVTECINTGVTVALTQNQFDALCDFVYNVGRGDFEASTLLRVLNLSQYAQIPSEIQRWVYSEGKVLPALVTRRQAESQLWNGA
jgi:lysozyme